MPMPRRYIKQILRAYDRATARRLAEQVSAHSRAVWSEPYY
jgi:hypothetical protein